jgi:tetratricopeptide (TPR) repeat protein
VFSQTGENAYLDTSSQKYNNLLFILNRNNMENYFRGVYYNSDSELQNTNRLLPIAINFYNEGNYGASIDNLINARKGNRRDYGLVYYYLGLCLMDINSLELAKQSFKEAIDYFYNHALRYIDYGMEHLFSYDYNGLGREPYFAFYNLACIESLENNVDSAYEYLHEALFHGYPYINHIRNDSDLINLFRDRSRLRAIESVYNAGTHNSLIGKCFHLDHLDGGIIQYVYFRNRNTIDKLVIHENGKFIVSATYEIKNYVIFSEIFTYGFRDFNAYVKQFEGLDYHGINFREISFHENDWSWK